MCKQFPLSHFGYELVDFTCDYNISDNVEDGQCT